MREEIEASESWQRVRSIDWTADQVQSLTWFAGLLAATPPPRSITGYWFGIFNPVRNDEPLSDFYIMGSAKYPDEEWFFEQDWRPQGRYATSSAKPRSIGELLPTERRLAPLPTTSSHSLMLQRRSTISFRRLTVVCFLADLR